MGHDSESIHEVYVKPDAELLRRAAEVLPGDLRSTIYELRGMKWNNGGLCPRGYSCCMASALYYRLI